MKTDLEFEEIFQATNTVVAGDLVGFREGVPGEAVVMPLQELLRVVQGADEPGVTLISRGGGLLSECGGGGEDGEDSKKNRAHSEASKERRPSSPWASAAARKKRDPAKPSECAEIDQASAGYGLYLAEGVDRAVGLGERLGVDLDDGESLTLGNSAGA